MAWLGEQTADDRPMTEHVEEALYRHRQSLFGKLSVAFFDTTSLYFEGQGGATLGERGFSKDFRPQLHQVVLGLVLDDHDRPIASFLWPGNTADVTTLLPVVERLRTRFGIGRACVVADRGETRAALLAGLERKLTQGDKALVGNAGYRRFLSMILACSASLKACEGIGRSACSGPHSIPRRGQCRPCRAEACCRTKWRSYARWR
jgi:hypothetical protein